MKLTDRQIKNLKPKSERYEVWEGRGFGIRVFPSGIKSWVYMYRFDGKAKRITFGNYPKMSVAVAHAAFGKALADLEKGIDPGVAMVNEARHKTFKSINFFMVDAYWSIGKRIVEEEQKGEQRTEYGAYLLRNLSKFLSAEFGQGFSERSLRNIRQFYLCFPIRSTLWTELTWSHYKSLVRIENPKTRDWYAAECIANNWSVRALDRQISSLYYERLLSSTDRTPVLKEAEEKTRIYKPT